MCHCRFKNYALIGKGIGLKIVFLFSLLIAVAAAAVFVKYTTDQIKDPSTAAFIDSLPVIKIENGKIVEPIYTHEVLIVPGAAGDAKIILDTAQDDVSAIAPDESVYITAKNIYTRQNNEVKIYQLPETFSKVITHDVIRTYIHQAVLLAAGIMAFSVVIFSIMGFVVVFLALGAFGFLVNKSLSLSAWGRISAWPWSLVFILYTVSSYKFTMHLGYLFLIPILISLIIGAHLKKCTAVGCVEDDGCQFSLTKVPSPFLIADETITEEAKTTDISKEVETKKTKKPSVKDEKKQAKTSSKKATIAAKTAKAKKK